MMPAKTLPKWAVADNSGTSENGWKVCPVCQLHAFGAISVSFTLTLDGEGDKNPVDVRLFGGNADDFSDEIIVAEVEGVDDRVVLSHDASLRFYRVRFKASETGEFQDLSIHAYANAVART